MVAAGEGGGGRGKREILDSLAALSIVLICLQPLKLKYSSTGCTTVCSFFFNGTLLVLVVYCYCELMLLMIDKVFAASNVLQILKIILMSVLISKSLCLLNAFEGFFNYR